MKLQQCRYCREYKDKNEYGAFGLCRKCTRDDVIYWATNKNGRFDWEEKQWQEEYKLSLKELNK